MEVNRKVILIGGNDGKATAEHIAGILERAGEIDHSIDEDAQCIRIYEGAGVWRRWVKSLAVEIANDELDDWLTHVRAAWLKGELKEHLPEFKRQARKIRGFRMTRLHEYLVIACQNDDELIGYGSLVNIN